jgi:hypothetical protein
MNNYIIITNSLNLNNKKITYKFSLYQDKLNWKTLVKLNINLEKNQEFISEYNGDLFINVLSEISNLFMLPFEYNNKVYSGPEIKVNTSDNHTNIYWENITHTDSAFNIPSLYVSKEEQELYNSIVYYLIKLSDDIFRKKLN